MDAWGRFQGRRIDSTCLQWAFCPAKHGWKSFLTLTSFLAPISDFKNLKGTWHQMLARSRQLQGIFGLLKPFLHVQILICFVDVYQNHGVVEPALSWPNGINFLVAVESSERAREGEREHTFSFHSARLTHSVLLTQGREFKCMIHGTLLPFLS